jgi:chromosome segregation ATPase
VAVAATDIARVLLGAEFSGASAAFLQYAQTYYMETYTTAMGDTFRTTQERARLYRDLEDAYADSPEDRGRIGGIVRRAEDFFRRTDDAEQNRRPLTPEEIRRGVRVGVETNEEIRRITARIARIQERIDRGEDPRTVISQAGPEVQNYFRRANGLHALSSEILRRLPNDTPEALARREAVARQLRDLDQRWRGARANPAQRAAVLREFRRVLDATNVENEQQLMARLDTMAERAEHNPAWQARVQERNALQTRIRELAAQVDRDGEDGERATEALRAIVRDLEGRTEEARARLPDAQALARQIAAGQDVEMRVLWQRRGLREDTELLRSARLALGEPEAPRAPGGPTTARTTTSETTAGAAAATEPAAARPQTAHQPSAEDPMP